MAVRARRSFRRFRRRRPKWDMQTFRLCEQQLDFFQGFERTCNDPAVDFVKILQPSSGELQGAARALMFGGGHLRIRYNTAIIDHDDCPCSHAVYVLSAIVKLPLLEDDLTPAYLPNLAVTRTFDSVVLASNADNDEDILWWHSEQLEIQNLSCVGGGGIQCANSGTSCSGTGADDELFVHLKAVSGGVYGRMAVDHTLRVRRRIREREALFLTTQFFSNLGTNFGECPGWPFRRNVYLRYAVRPSR